MKKLFMILCLSLSLVLVFATIAMAESTIKLGYDFSGKHKFSNSGVGVEFDTDSALNIGYEYTIPQDQFEYGFGVEYQFERSVKNVIPTTNKFNFIPIYALINFNLSDNKDVQPYITGRLGYNFFNANSDYTNGSKSGGIYYGAGFGVSFNQAKVEILYSANKGSLSVGGNTIDIDNNQITFNFGYKF